MEKQRNEIKLIILDLDGTLVNLEINYERIRKKLRNLFKEYEIEENFESIVSSLQRVLRRIKERSGSEEYERVKSEVFSILDEEEMKAKIKTLKESKEILKKLSKNFRLALITRNGRKITEKSLKKMEAYNFFQKIVTREDVEDFSDKKEASQKILKEFNVKPKEILFVDDKEWILKEIHSLGFNCFLVKTPKDLKKLEEIYL